MTKLLSERYASCREWVMDDGKRAVMTLLANHEILLKIYQVHLFGMFKKELGGYIIKSKSLVSGNQSPQPTSEPIDTGGLTGLSRILKQSMKDIPKNAALEALMISLMAMGKTCVALDSYLMTAMNNSKNGDWIVERL